MIALELSLENLYRQYHACRRNKRNTVNALRFEADQEKNLIALREALRDRTYRPARSVCFFTTKPKLREIFAADFRDRVVHHLLVDYLERIWEPIFIHDSYAYCDDFVLLSPERDQLVAWRERIEDYLRAALALDLNPRERLRPVSDGIDFLGYIVRRDYRLVRRRVVNPLKTRLRAYREPLVTAHAGTVTYRFDAAELHRLRATLSSYLGHFGRANAYRLWQSLWQGQDWLAVYFDWDAQRHRLIPRYAMPKGLTNVRQQYAWVRGRFPGDVALFQVGAYYELYDRRDAPVAQTLGLQPLKENRRRALYGIPQRLFGRYLDRLLGMGQSVVVVRQGEQQWTGIRERVLAWRMVPGAA